MIDWKPMSTYKPKRGKHYIFWQPQSMNGRTMLPARVIGDVAGGQRGITHWAEVKPPADAAALVMA